MNSIQFILQPLPATDEQFNERLRELSDKIHKYGYGTHRVFEQIKVPVKEVVIGPNHIGILLEDGKALRVAYSLNTDRMDLSKTESSKSISSAVHLNSIANKSAAVSATRPMARSRARLMRTSGRSPASGQGSGSRSSGVIIGGAGTSRPLVTAVPATYVPEELISQAEVVLQGKSRNLIIRELQRTNLDVNLAVNNLLSRDDEEAEDTEDGGDNYVPEELISLLDNGFHGENSSVIIDPSDGLFSEEIFGNYSSIRNLLFDRIRSERNQSTSTNSDNSQSRGPNTSNNIVNSNTLTAQLSTVSSDREAFSRWRDRQYYGPRRWMHKEEFSIEKDAESKKKEQSISSPIWISEELQYWPDRNILKFKKIAALYSEFIAITDSGELHQWKWSDPEPFKSEQSEGLYHPKSLALNINEKVELISASFIRCTIVTENNRVATWLDEQLGFLGLKLEHSALLFNEFILDPIVSVNVCSLYSAVRTENNNIYWWGALPFEHRRCLWDKFRSKTKKPFKNLSSEIAVGSVVVMKKYPIYQSGSIGFTCANGIPKVGQLLNSVWDFTDISRFKILNVPLVSIDKTNSGTANIEKEMTKAAHLTNTISQTSNNLKSNVMKETTDRIDMPPPPSPASSTCSDSGSVNSHKRSKRVAAKEENDVKRDEEIWQLKDVIFIEDKVGPIGKVLKVDGDFVAVRFPASSNNGNMEGKEDDWQQCRLLRREDIQVHKNGSNARGPDWIQKTPKKININHGNEGGVGTQILSLAVDNRGIHIIKKIGSKVHYSLYNLHNSKQEQNCQFPTDGISFMSTSPNNISMICDETFPNMSTIMVLDGNRALYPILKDCTGTIKDPHWYDLPPIKCLTASTVSLSNSGTNQKSKISIAAFLIENQKLMPHILRSDIKSIFSVINSIENDESSEWASITLERCDGSRNIFHAATFMCVPTSNKDIVDDKKNIPSNTSVKTSSTSPFVGTFAGSTSTDLTANNSNGGSFSNVPNNLSSSNNREGRTVSLREMMMNSIINFTDNTNNTSSPNNVDDHLYLSSWSTDTNSIGVTDNAENSVEEDASKVLPGCSSSAKLQIPFTEPMQKREQAIHILQQLCNNTNIKPYLFQLLSAKDSQGMTPFMLSVTNRAYEAGLILLNTILNIAENDDSLKEAMIFPPGSPPDQSPLYVICYNDTCSFTWTGADHINQNIYECKTCGLTGSLCCCTECARVCHKGHDCKLKRTSPTAYCDCWEKCKCKALIAGDQSKRFVLLNKLIGNTDLVSKFNSKGESILLFLIQTVGRQIIEQRQYRANTRVRNIANASSNGNSQGRKTSAEVEQDMPEHDLEPPKFSRKALEFLLNDWNAVKSMIMAGAEHTELSGSNNLGPTPHSSENVNVFLQTQNGSTLLDKFTHNLFVKCTTEHLDILLATLSREMLNSATPHRIEEACEVARRFVRSVTRIFVIFNLEKLPNPEKKKSNLSSTKHMQSCIKVFQTLLKISIEELCEASEALIAPVRLGAVRPTAPFPMSSSNNDNSDDLFCVEPLAPSNMEPSVEVPDHTNELDQNVEFNLQRNYSVEGTDVTMREPTETDETINHSNNQHIAEEDMLEPSRAEETLHDEESDNDFPFNDGETDSDSDDNQSNQDAQRSVQTGATVGSETDESGDSSPQEEDGSDEAESDDQSDEFGFNEQALERQGNSSTNRGEATPLSMQWAVRSREPGRSSVRVPPGSSLVFIDPVALRRSTVPTQTTVPPTTQDHHTMATTASNLSRAFSIILRQITELLCINNDNSVKLSNEDSISVHTFVEHRLHPTWMWMYSILDSTEAQLKFGAYLSNHADPSHPLHPLNLSSNGNQSSSQSSVNVVGSTSRRDFFSYCLSLMRAHSFEHRDSLPVLDVTALRHIAYVLDGFIYYMRYDANFYDRPFGSSNNSTFQSTEYEDTDEELSNFEDPVIDIGAYSTSGSNISSIRRNSFFVRSDSTLSLGSLAQEGFDLPVDISIPLADKPHLLQTNSKRQDLFNNQPLVLPKTSSRDFSAKDSGYLSIPPVHLGFSTNEHFNQKNVHIFDNSTTSADIVTNSVFVQNEEGLNSPRNVDSATIKRPEIIISPTSRKRSIEVISNPNLVQSVIVRAGPSNLDEYRNLENITSEKSQVLENCKEAPNEPFTRGYLFCRDIRSDSEISPWNFLLGRWKLTLELFGRVFLDDVGMEHGSILPELRGFPVKENRFRRQMEKLRNGQQRDLILCKLERNRENLIIQTFKELNTQFGNQNRRIHPPLTFNRVKVTFKDEPGEGSGVARSFYTSISEALLACAKMPNLEAAQVGNNSKVGVPFSSILRNRSGSVRELQSVPRRGGGSRILWRTNKEKKVLNYDARPYLPVVGAESTDNPNDHLSVHLQQLGERLYPKINQINQEYASKITGMLLEIPASQFVSILTSEEVLRQKVNEALEIINNKQKMEMPSVPSQHKKVIPVVLLEQCQVEDNEPLFYSPGKRGFYTPCQGLGSFERLNAFRNIGRLIGLCLLQNELLPLYLQRHVLKYILGRKIKFHDLAFFDPVVYESLRQLVVSAQDENCEDIFNRMDIYFCVDLRKEEGGGSVELSSNGRETQVTANNVLDYIKRYTEYRLIKSQEKALESMKEGVFDVVPDNCMNNLTAEDLRLLLNGVGDINVSTLISYTSFNDESSEVHDKLLKFKRWFWSIVEKMNTSERQDLVYFWTGSPALPASEEGFQPLPSVTIRPADDSHLPTANTCISRLYIPLYSSKAILRSKLLMAIKSKNFGFV